MEVNSSIAFHLETNKPCEIINYVIDKHLYTFHNYHQNDCSMKLATTEFGVKNNQLSFTKFYLYFFIEKLHSSISLNQTRFCHGSTCERILTKKPWTFLKIFQLLGNKYKKPYKLFKKVG